VHTRRS